MSVKIYAKFGENMLIDMQNRAYNLEALGGPIKVCLRVRTVSCDVSKHSEPSVCSSQCQSCTQWLGSHTQDIDPVLRGSLG